MVESIGDIIDAELYDVRARLYDAIETGKITLDDISERTRELND